MSGSPILPLELQLPSLAVLGLFLAWVLRLIRTHRLGVRESLVWLLSTLAAMVITAFPSVLSWAAHLLRIQVPSNALFGAGLLYLALNVLAVTLATSASTDRVRRLAQECALLRAELDALRARVAEAEPRPEAPPARRAGEQTGS
jgi:hypothetical protein